MENETKTPATEAEPEKPVTGKRKPRGKKKPGAPKSGNKAAVNPPKPAGKLVILFRHGIAEDPGPEKADGDRSLTTAGHDRTKRSAKGLSKFVGKVDAIVSSPLLRALQTALWVTKAWGGKVQIQTTDALLPDAPPDEVLKLVRESPARTVILVGHEPNLTRCMGELLGVSELQVNLRRAGCAGIAIDEEGRGTLEWVLAPRILRGL